MATAMAEPAHEGGQAADGVSNFIDGDDLSGEEANVELSAQVC